MAATEIANAYISLTTKMPSVRADIARALGASDVQGVANKQGSSLGNKLMKSMGVAAVAGAAVVAAGVVSTLGAAFVKGFNRLNQIDVAKAKLRGLGHDASTVQTIMDNALESVRGTSHGLGEAAGVAAKAVAAGIKPGRELEGVLGTVANSASAAGVSMEEMGSIFAKAATQANGVQNDVIAQLADRGIPIYQALADQLGVTAGEVFNLASSGKVNFEQFAAAATAASGTVAQEMGGTVQGSLANLGASLGRIGAGLLGGVFGQIAPTLQDITAALAPLEAVAARVGERVGKVLAPAFEWFRNTISSGFDLGKFVDMASYFSPLGLAFKALQPVLPPIMKALGDIGAVLVDMAQRIMPVLLPVFQTLVTLLTEVFKAVVPIVQMLVSALVPVFQALAPIITTVLQAFAPLIEILAKILTPILRLVASIVSTILAPVLKALVEVIKVVAGIVLWLIQGSFKHLVNILRVIGDAFSWLYKNIIQPVWSGIQSAIGVAWNWINKNVFSPMKTGIDAVGKAFDAVGKFIGEVWTRVQNAAKAPVKFLINTVWNNGIRSFAVDVLKALGLNDLARGLPRVALPFANGGVLPGYTPGRDVHQFYSPTGGRLALSGGEAIMRPEFTRLVGGKAGVDRLNAAARSGSLAFKNGGVLGELGNFAGDVWDNIANAASTAWDFISDPAGAVKKHMSGFIKGLGGNGVFSDLVAGVPKMLLRGFEQMFGSVNPPSRGSSGMGWRAMQSIVLKNIPGARISSGYRSAAGNAAVGGVKGSYHTQGRAIDVVPPSMAMFNSIKRLFPNAAELIYTPAGGSQLRNGRPFAGWSAAVRRAHFNHIHLAMANGGVVPQLFDQGGWLPHGGVAVNRSGKPEPVLTNDQWKLMADGGLRSGDRLRLVVDGREFSAYVDGRADGRLGAAFASVSDMAVASEFGR